MTARHRSSLTRRDLLLGTVAASVAGAVAHAASPSAAPAAPAGQTAVPGGAILTRPIPVSGERLPVIGLGTNNYSPTTPAELADRRAVIAQLPRLGGTVIDTAPAYRQSEATLGELMAELGNRRQLWLASKVTAPGGSLEQAEAQMKASFERLRTDVIELMQVHNLDGTDLLMPVLESRRREGRYRYLGLTTSRAAQYPELLAAMRRHRLDFVQVDYSIANRAAAREILPLAQSKGIAVLINMPFGGRRDGNIFGRVKGRPLPAWAKDIGASSWGQVFLKYVVSHPAVTCAIPGTTKVSNLEDNLAASRGALPDATLRARMEQDWDAIAGAV